MSFLGKLAKIVTLGLVGQSNNSSTWDMTTWDSTNGQLSLVTAPPVAAAGEPAIADEPPRTGDAVPQLTTGDASQTPALSTTTNFSQETANPSAEAMQKFYGVAKPPLAASDLPEREKPKPQASENRTSIASSVTSRAAASSRAIIVSANSSELPGFLQRAIAKYKGMYRHIDTPDRRVALAKDLARRANENGRPDIARDLSSLGYLKDQPFCALLPTLVYADEGWWDKIPKQPFSALSWRSKVSVNSVSGDPPIGSIAVIDRGNGRGHVGFYMGRDPEKANMRGLFGFNQSDFDFFDINDKESVKSISFGYPVGVTASIDGEAQYSMQQGLADSTSPGAMDNYNATAIAAKR